MNKARGLNGFALITVATAIAGVGGYAIQWVAARSLGTTNYGVFIVFWSALYLIVGALSGVQQEVTRATHPKPRRVAVEVGRARTLRFAATIAVLVLVVIVALTPLWVGPVFATDGAALIWPLALGTAFYVIVASSLGTLYGIQLWRPLAMMIVLDVALRLAAVAIGLVLNVGVVGLGWATVVPYPLTLIVLWLIARKRISEQSTLDVGYLDLSWNVLRTIAAAASTAVLVSGFPVLLRVTSLDASSAIIGALSLSITLTRAPLVVTTMALQSYLVVFFRERRDAFWRALGLILAGIAFTAGSLSILAWWLAPLLLEVLFGPGYKLDGGYLALLVASSAATGALSVTGAAVLARGGHATYSMSWLVAAAAALATLLLPLDILDKALLALTVGPLIGLVMQLILLARHGSRSKSPRPPAEAPR
jgi:O-antigen/teichoic acid export membrane protein